MSANPLKILVYGLLLVTVGIPLWICEKLTGKQPARLIDWLDEKLSP